MRSEKFLLQPQPTSSLAVVAAAQLGCPARNTRQAAPVLHSGAAYVHLRPFGLAPERQPSKISGGLGWRMHDSVEDTKLSTNKQHSLPQPPVLTHKLRPAASLCADALPRGVAGQTRTHAFSSCRSPLYAPCAMHPAPPEETLRSGSAQRPSGPARVR